MLVHLVTLMWDFVWCWHAGSCQSPRYAAFEKTQLPDNFANALFHGKP